ncbi:MAG: carboxypeptidase regulatory-like domain-containing protein [bacterium]|nr:carboxypeptidase regulatory-like domain-containing protein [bacterium]
MKKMSFHVGLMVVSTLFCSCLTEDEEQQHPTGNIAGVITDSVTGSGLAGAVVSTVPITTTAISDANGQFNVSDVAVGSYLTSAAKTGYSTRTVSTSVLANQTATVYMSLEVLRPTLHVSTTNLSFGTTTTTITLSIQNSTGYGELQWTIEEDSPWLSVSPLTGTTTLETDLVTVSVDRSGLSAGNYQGQLQVVSTGGSQPVGVLVTVPDTSGPQLTVSPLELDFGSNQSTAIVSVTNTGIGTLSWSVVEAYPWVSVNPSSGTTSTETDQLVFTIDRTVVAVGIHQGQVAITALQGGNAAVSLSMEVTPSAIPPVTLNEPTNVTTHGMTLAWTRTEITNFALYRLYRSTTPGVSNLSTLVYETSSRTSNLFSDTGLSSGTTYYYRVYLLATDQSESGSNEISGTTMSQVGTWSTIYSPPNNNWYGSAICMIGSNVGYFGFNTGSRPTILYWDGSIMTEETLPAVDQNESYSYISDIEFINSNEVYASYQYPYSNPSQNSGLYMFNGSTWSKYQALDNMSIYSLEITPSGNLWVGSNGFLKRKIGSQITTYNVDATSIMDIHALSDDNIFCCDIDGKIFHYDGFGWALITNPPIGVDNCESIYASSVNDIYIDTKKSLYRYDGFSWNLVLQSRNTSSKIRDVYIRSESNIWLGGYMIDFTDDNILDRFEFAFYDGTSFRGVESPSNKEIVKIQFFGNVGWAVDTDGNVLRYSE